MMASAVFGRLSPVPMLASCNVVALSLFGGVRVVIR